MRALAIEAPAVDYAELRRDVHAAMERLWDAFGALDRAHMDVGNVTHANRVRAERNGMWAFCNEDFHEVIPNPRDDDEPNVDWESDTKDRIERGVY